jgi:hypothetical protein
MQNQAHMDVPQRVLKPRWRVELVAFTLLLSLLISGSAFAEKEFPDPPGIITGYVRFQSPYQQTSGQDIYEPLPEYDPWGQPRMAMAPHGYPSGYPGDVTSQGAPLGGAPAITAPIIVGQPAPLYADPQFMPPGPQAIVTPESVIIQEPGAATIVAGPPAGVKSGPLQRVEVQGTYLPDLGGDGLQVIDLEHSFTIGLPFPDRDSPLLITPGFDVHFLSGETTTDLPGTLYDTYISVRWLRRLNDKILLNSSVAPGWYSDWQTNNTNALRAPAQSLIIYDWTEHVQLIAGIVYLDRDDLKFLPALGIIYKPNDRFRLEAVMPRPRIAWRIRKSLQSEDWLSISGEFGGGQWAVERADGREDILASRDYRLILGIERKNLVGNLGSRIELGYVFGRTFEYRISDDPDYEPGSTMLIRGGVIY